MPIAKKSSEKKSDYISRCISHYIKKGDEQDVAAGKCYSMWETMRIVEEKFRVVKEYRKRKV